MMGMVIIIYEKGLTTSQIPADYVEDYFMRYHKIQLEAKQTFNESAKKELANRRKKFAYATPFREGQWVLYSQLPIKDGTIKIPALLPRKVGPFKVKEVRKGTYVLDVESCVNENDREVVRSVQTRDRDIFYQNHRKEVRDHALFYYILLLWLWLQEDDYHLVIGPFGFISLP